MERDLTPSLVLAGESPHPHTRELKSRHLLDVIKILPAHDRGTEHLGAAHKALQSFKIFHNTDVYRREFRRLDSWHW